MTAFGLAAVSLVFAVLLVLGNPDLAAPGPQLLPLQAYESWRLTLGIALWSAAVAIAAGILAASRPPRTAWLTLLILLPLLALYLIGGALMPTFVLAMTVVIFLGLVIPVVVGVVGVAVGRAVRRRRSSAPAV
ncbi:hypothetical protein ELQ94_06655 [Labedella endophytica]|uniref:Uncharacterized protein n=1 Tax=Labedella endophytica TaxID=1523160 RepID=A0A433JT82_9MICO|nr:hypothetical protein ELQ94_06655 [Labedella endophytica]